MDTKSEVTVPPESESRQSITEGSAIIETTGSVFYNPVQEFNRDLSISVIKAFAKIYNGEDGDESEGEEETAEVENENSIDHEEGCMCVCANVKKAGIKHENGLFILEALSATGLRSIRYAKEIPGVKEIVANDISLNAVEDIKNNITKNNVEHLVTPSHDDAVMLMYQHRKENQFDVIDLDPYGCPSIFLDSAVQAIKDGGLLLITATDMAVLAGNSPETCYCKYGAISLRIKCCHEMALRILLQCVEAHANRYGRYIVPLLSLSADFYIRIFVRVFTGPSKCKHTTSKLSHVYHCTGCDTFVLQPLGTIKMSDVHKKEKFGIPTGPPVSKNCEHCDHPHHIGGPIWSAPLHCPEFVPNVLNKASKKLSTFKRIQGVLAVISEELLDIPLYYTLEKLSGTLHVEMPPMMSIRSALLNAGYKVSYTHMSKTSIKTDAPPIVIWDIMRSWAKEHPVAEKRLLKDSPAANILAKEPKRDYSFKMHVDANPPSRKMGFLRFQENPSSHWGPGQRSSAMIGDHKILKSRKNQGKRKREQSQESVDIKQT